jgi:hypothetical protein
MYVPKKQDQNQNQEQAEWMMQHCTSNQDSKLWDVDYCRRLLEQRITPVEIQKRKMEVLIPGTMLEVKESDARVPIMLLHRGLEDPGWDLVAPKGWAMSLLHLFQYAGCRAGSLQTVEVDRFENGQATEVFDYPEMPMYQSICAKEQEKKRNVFKTTPKRYRKQCPWNGFGVDLSPLLSDDVVVWHSSRSVGILQKSIREASDFTQCCTMIMEQLNDLCSSRPSFSKSDLNCIKNSFVRVEVKMKSGKIGWNSLIHKNIESHCEPGKPVDPQDYVGFVLRGSFSQSEGTPRGIGIVSLQRLFESKGQVAIRTLTGKKSYPAKLTLIS